MFIFLYKFGQALCSLTLTISYMWSKKKQREYGARIVLGRVYEGCMGWEEKFPSQPTFGCLAECMKGAWVHTSSLTQIHEEETTILRWECNQTQPHALCYSDWSAPSEFDPTVMLHRDMDMPMQRAPKHHRSPSASRGARRWWCREWNGWKAMQSTGRRREPAEERGIFWFSPW